MKFIALALFTLLAGCSLTQEQKMAIAAGMHSAGQGMYEGAERLKQQMHEQNLQPINMYPLGRPTNCLTEYNSFMRAYETRCQ